MNRREFLKLASVGAGLLACKPFFNGSAPSERENVADGGLAFFYAATRLKPSAIEITETLITNPEQRNYLLQLFAANDQASQEGLATLQREAIENGTAIGCSICSDSRVPNLPANVAIGGSEIFPVTNRAVAAQPFLYRGINQSMFVAHASTADTLTGCGGLGGIAHIIETGSTDQLVHHGVSSGTISRLQELYSLGNNGSAESWALVGAQMQAELNLQLNGTNHFVGYGIAGHADNSFRFLGIVDSYGNVIKPINLTGDSHAMIAGLAEYLNSVGPVNEALRLGQQPAINVLNASTYTTETLLNTLARTPNEMFVRTAQPGLDLSEAIQAVQELDYSFGALTQRGKIFALIADSADDMVVLRTALFAQRTQNAGFNAFMENGGIIVELYPEANATGKFFRDYIVAQTKDISRGVLSLSEAEIKLSQRGLYRLVHTMRAESLATGQTVRIRSTLTNQQYDVFIPSGTRNINVQMLREAGIPLSEAKMLETWLSRAGSFVKPGLLILAGVVTIAESARLTHDALGLGDSVQSGKGIQLFNLDGTSYPEILDPELADALSRTGLNATNAFAIVPGNTIAEIADTIKRRADFSSWTSPSFHLRFDDVSAQGIPLVAYDRDIASPIIVSGNGDAENSPTIVQYTNELTNETTTFELIQGLWVKTSGPDSIKFSYPINTGTGTYVIPFELRWVPDKLGKLKEITIPAIPGLDARTYLNNELQAN